MNSDRLTPFARVTLRFGKPGAAILTFAAVVVGIALTAYEAAGEVVEGLTPRHLRDFYHEMRNLQDEL